MDFPNWMKAVILGAVEGLTEFLPVSSTGHLMVFGKWLNFNSELFIIFIQIGALAAVWWLFRQRLFQMVRWNLSENRHGKRLCVNVTLAFLPALFMGYLLKDWDRSSISVIAWALIVGGIAILVIESLRLQGKIDRLEGITPQLALLIGVGQCLSLCPGVSRSGATMMTGLAVGLSRAVIAEFTFLLAVPTMTAAATYELWKYRSELSGDMIGLLGIGFLTSFVVAWVVVKWFIHFVQNHTFEGLAWYRIAAGIFLLILDGRLYF